MNPKIKNKTKQKKKKKHDLFLFQIYSLTILASSEFGLKETLFESQMTKSRIPNTWLIQCGSQRIYLIGFVDNVSEERQYKDYCLISDENDSLEMSDGLVEYLTVANA